MDNMDQFKTPLNKPPPLRSGTATKRDSLAAELERDPALSTSKRQHRSHLFTSSISHASLERQLLASQTTALELQTKLREKELAVERLERDRMYFAEREKEEREGRENERRVYEEEKKKTSSELRTLRTSLSSLTESHTDLQDTHASLTRTSSQSIQSLKSQLQSSQHHSSALEQEVDQLKHLVDVRDNTIQTLQTQLDQLLEERETAHRVDIDESSMKIVREELARQAEYLAKLERENVKLGKEVGVLRERERSVEVVREEKRALEGRVRGVEILRRRVGELESEVGVLRRERDEGFKSRSSQQPGDTPVPLTQALSELRLTHARLLDEHGAVVSRLKEKEGEVGDIRDREQKALRETRQLQVELDTLKDAKERVERRVGMCEREVGFLRALVASYDAEQSLTQTSSTHPAPTDENSADATDTSITMDDTNTSSTLVEISRQRIHNLEIILEEYKEMNEGLVKELEELGVRRGGDEQQGGRRGDEQQAGARHGDEQQAGARHGDEEEQDVKPTLNDPSFKQRLEELEKEVEELKSERDELREELTTTTASLESTSQTLFDLQGEIGAGRHVPPNTRILTMTDNPEEEWFRSRKEIIERLKAENEALVGRLREVEEGRGVGRGQDRNFDENTNPNNQNQGQNNQHTNQESYIPPESYSSLLAETQSLQSLLHQKEKRLQRLQEIFKSKSAEFRDAIASILGVKLAFYPNGGVRVTSVFDLYASFVFMPGRGTGATGDSSNPSNDPSTTTTMQLIAQGEGGPEDIRGMMEYWIGKEQCIPGFMASLTLECWEKQRSSGGG